MPPTATFLLQAGDPARIVVQPGQDVDGLLEHRLVSAAACTLLSMRGDVVLHASAVEIGGEAVIFCGETGRGKSSLAHALGEPGHAVLSEDGIAISLAGAGPIAFPGARGVRVRSANGEDGTKLLPDPGPTEPAPSAVAAVVLLGGRGPALTVEPLDGARGLALLTSHLVHTGGRESIAAAFGSLATLLHSIPSLAASLPDDLAALPGASQELLDMLPGSRLDWAQVPHGRVKTGEEI